MRTLELPFPPSVNKIWLRRKRGGIYLNPDYAEWKEHCNGVLLSKRSELGPMITGPFEAFITLDESRRTNKDGSRKKNIDADNRVKAVLDWLERAAVILNDSLLDKLQVEWGPVNGVRVTLVEKGGK